MDDGKLQAIRIALMFLFAIYCAPFFLLGFSCLLTQGWERSDLVLKAFVGFTQTQDQSLALLHRAILPIMGAFAPLAFQRESGARWSIAFVILLLSSIAISLVLDALFNTMAIQNNLYALGIFPLPGSVAGPAAVAPTSGQVGTAFAAGMTLVNAFFNRTQEAMTMYVLLIFGLKAAEQAKA